MRRPAAAAGKDGAGSSGNEKGVSRRQKFPAEVGHLKWASATRGVISGGPLSWGPPMADVSIAQALSGKVPAGEQVTVKGWVRTRRDSKGGFSFLAVNDGSCFDSIQVVAPGALPNYQAEVLHITTGCSVISTGTLVQSQGKGQSYEIQATKVEVVGWVDDPDTYPVSPKQHTFEYLREVAHLRPRTNTIGAVTRVRHTLSQAVHRFFHERGFFWIHTPIITTSDAEGAGQMFRVSTLDLANLPRTPDGKVDFAKDFFGKETRL